MMKPSTARAVGDVGEVPFFDAAVEEEEASEEVEEEGAEDSKEEDAESSDESEIDYETMTVSELKELLKEAGKPVSGKKADLISRLQE